MKNLITITIFGLLGILFFYNLGSYGLADYDEGWYADIARHIAQTGDLFAFKYNYLPYYDHPPLGFWLMALSSKIFGLNEFAMRFPSALLGFLSLVIIYKIGQHFYNRIVGIEAALILSSSVWFIFRARTGNLDAILIFFYLASLLAAFKKRYLWLGIFFGSCLLSKSLVGLSLLLPIAIIFIINKTKPKQIIIFLITTFIIITPWLLISFNNYGIPFIQRLIHIGLRPGMGMTPDWLHLLKSNTFIYLHSGMRQWFWPGLIALIISPLLIFKKRKEYLTISALILALLLSFVSNTDTSIWHLLPLFPLIAILISSISYLFFKKISLVLIFIIAISQIYTFRNEIQLQSKGYSDSSILAVKSKQYPEKLFLDGPDLLPTIVYYSQKPVNMVYWSNPQYNSLYKIINYGPKPFLLITDNWRLIMDKIPNNNYQLIYTSGDKKLLLVK